MKQFFIVASVFVFVFGYQTFAQSNTVSVDTKESIRLEDVNVKVESENKKKRIKETEVTTVIESKVINKSQVTDMAETLKLVPGVEIQGGSNPISRKVVVRGMTGDRIKTYVDGAPRANYITTDAEALMMEPEHSQAVEVKKGANSSEYGGGSIGGTVLLKTKEVDQLLLPGRTIGAQVKLGSSSANTGQIQSISVYGKNRAFSGLLIYTQRKMGKTESGLNDPGVDVERRSVNESKYNQESVLAKFQLKLNRRHKLDIKWDQTQAKNSEDTYYPGSLGPKTNFNGNVQDAQIGWKYQPKSKWINTHLQIMSVRQEGVKDVYGLWKGSARFQNTETNLRNTLGLKVSNISKLGLSNGSLLKVKVGLEGFEEELSSDDRVNPVTYYGTSRGRDSGLYTKLIWSSPRDKFEVNSSARYSSYRRESLKLAATAPSKSGDFTSWRIGAAYKLSKHIKLFSNYDVSHRAPSVREMYKGGGEAFPCHRPTKECKTIPNTDLVPEVAKSLEGGVLWDVAKFKNVKGGIKGQLSYFNSDINDYLEHMPFMYKIGSGGERIPAGPAEATHRDYQTLNLNKVLRNGIELQTAIDWKQWKFTTAASRIIANCEKCPNYFFATTQSQPLTSTPADKLRISGEYTLSTAPLSIGIDGTFTAKTSRLSNSQKEAGLETGSYEVYNMYAQWEPKKGTLKNTTWTVGIDNLFDRKYVVHNSSSGNFELGRNIKMSFSKLF